mgnify:FL=1
MSGYQDIDFQQARDILDREADSVLLDVREEEEFITGHPMEAELLPLSTLGPATAAEVIPGKDSPALVYCRSGIRSRQAAEKLVQMGYTRVYNLGSLVGWPYGMV